MATVGLRLRLLMWQPVPAGWDSCENHGRRAGCSRRPRLMFHLAGVALARIPEQDLTGRPLRSPRISTFSPFDAKRRAGRAKRAGPSLRQLSPPASLSPPPAAAPSPMTPAAAPSPMAPAAAPSPMTPAAAPSPMAPLDLRNGIGRLCEVADNRAIDRHRRHA
jgi:hypothetical protein